MVGALREDCMTVVPRLGEGTQDFRPQGKCEAKIFFLPFHLLCSFEDRF